MHFSGLNEGLGKELIVLKDKIILYENRMKTNDALIEKGILDHARVNQEIIEHELELKANEACHQQYTLTKKLIQGWKVQDGGEFLHLVNDVFSDSLDTEMLSLCENFLKFREDSLIFKLMGHLWGYMSKLNCVDTSHVLSTELTDTLGKPPSSIPSSLLEEISDTEEDCIFVGSNVASAADPKSISAKLVCDSPKLSFLNPCVTLKRLEKKPFLIPNKPRGGKGSRKFKSTLRKFEEIIPAAEGFKNDPCSSKVVPDPITLRFDVSRGKGNVCFHHSREQLQ
jgi:hypothetical protein